jgi:hypothetical protein
MMLKKHARRRKAAKGRYCQLDPRAMHEVAHELRDIKNWLAAFSSEYSLPDEVREKFHERLDILGEKLARLGCIPREPPSIHVRHRIKPTRRTALPRPPPKPRKPARRKSGKDHSRVVVVVETGGHASKENITLTEGQQR